MHELHAEAQALVQATVAAGAGQQRGRRRTHEECGAGVCVGRPTDSFSEDSGRGVSESGALRLNGALLAAAAAQNAAAAHSRALSTGQNPRLLQLTPGDPHRWSFTSACNTSHSYCSRVVLHYCSLQCNCTPTFPNWFRTLSSSAWPVIAQTPAAGDPNNNQLNNADYANHESASPFPPASRPRTPRTPDAIHANRIAFPIDPLAAGTSITN